MAHVAFVFCCVVWGSMFILVERVTHALGPVEIALWRFAGGAAVLGLLWWLRQRAYRPSRGDWAKIVLLALVFILPPQLILPYLMAQGFGHSFFGPMVAPIPLVTILVSIPLLGALPTKRQLVGVLGGLACVWLIVDDGVGRGMSLGFLALTLWIPVSAALSNTVIKWKLERVPAVPLTAAAMGVAGLALMPVGFYSPAIEALHLAAPAAEPATPLTWVYLFILGVIGTGLSTAVFIWMILERGPLFAGMTTYVVPVLALGWGRLDHEAITTQQMVAMAGVLAMVALVQSGGRRAEAPQPAAAEVVTLDGVAHAISPATLYPQPEVVTATLAAEVAERDRLATQPESQVA